MAAGPKGWTSILAWQPGPFKLISNVRANHDRICAHQRYASCPQTTCTRCLSPLCLELRRNLDSICQGHFLLVCHALLALRPSSRACSIPSHIPHFACLPRTLPSLRTFWPLLNSSSFLRSPVLSISAPMCFHGSNLVYARERQKDGNPQTHQKDGNPQTHLWAATNGRIRGPQRCPTPTMSPEAHATHSRS